MGFRAVLVIAPTPGQPLAVTLDKCSLLLLTYDTHRRAPGLEWLECSCLGDNLDQRLAGRVDARRGEREREREF